MPVFRLASAVLLLGTVCAACPAVAADSAHTAEPAANAHETPAAAGTPPPAAAAASAAVPPLHPAQNPPHHPACLTKSEQRAAVASKSAMSLGDAIKSVRAHGRRAEVVRARLCRHDEKLVYVLTLLGRSGRVREVAVDAVSGDLVAGR